MPLSPSTRASSGGDQCHPLREAADDTLRVIANACYGQLHSNRRSGKDRMHNITWFSFIISTSLTVAQVQSLD